LRAATPADLEAIERAWLTTFGGGPGAALSGVPFEVALAVRLALRRAVPDPAGGCYVACDGPALAGVIVVETAETAARPGVSALRHLRPLGLPAALRLLVRVWTTAYRPARDEAYLCGLAIAPPYRGRGIGTGLVALAEAAARRQGKRVASCVIAQNNAASLALARKRGFREAAAPASPPTRLLRRVPGRIPTVRLVKALASSRREVGSGGALRQPAPLP
jgi:ribosomal protein S18 acetylase RimI-like enzyme